MKKIIVPIICVFLIFATYIVKDKIVNFLVNIIEAKPNLIINNGNEYTKKEGFIYLQPSEDFIPYSYGDLLNILYSTVNNGWDTFTFYCPKEYYSCLDDINKIEQNSVLNYINDFVHPFNTAVSLTTTSYSSGEVTVVPTYLYSKDEIEKIDSRVTTILQNNIDKNLSGKDRIKAVHDYIINNVSYDTEYDINKVNIKGNKYHSNTAYGPLFEGKAICNGYADLMAIFLSKMGFKNYKVATPVTDDDSSVGHIWNAVEIDNKWYHLDLTWDDPISDNGKDYLFYEYFLVSTEEMYKVDSEGVKIEEHTFDKNVYLEFNELIYS